MQLLLLRKTLKYLVCLTVHNIYSDIYCPTIFPFLLTSFFFISSVLACVSPFFLPVHHNFFPSSLYSALVTASFLPADPKAQQSPKLEIQTLSTATEYSLVILLLLESKIYLFSSVSAHMYTYMIYIQEK